MKNSMIKQLNSNAGIIVETKHNKSLYSQVSENFHENKLRSVQLLSQLLSKHHKYVLHVMQTGKFVRSGSRHKILKIIIVVYIK